jgi:hypothetical protein
MILGYGFFHRSASGNLFVRPNGAIVMLDFGLAEDLPPGFGLGVFQLMFSMMTLNEAAMRKRSTSSASPPRPARRWLVSGAAHGRAVRPALRGDSPRDMTEELSRHPRQPIVMSDFVLVARALAH